MKTPKPGAALFFVAATIAIVGLFLYWPAAIPGETGLGPLFMLLAVAATLTGAIMLAVAVHRLMVSVDWLVSSASKAQRAEQSLPTSTASEPS